MYKKIYINFIIFFTFFLINVHPVYSEIVNKIEITGNDRISNETIKLFSDVSINDDLDKDNLNIILKNLYETNFFKNISIELNNNILLINVIENPIIENINYEGIKSTKTLNALKEGALVKSRSSYNDVILILRDSPGCTSGLRAITKSLKFITFNSFTSAIWERL